MRVLLTGLATVALMLAVEASAPASTELSARSAHLRLTKTAPLTVVGSRFASRERVRVTATVSGLSKKRLARASRRGTFSVQFPIGAGRCSAIRVVAVGRAGSKVLLKRLPGPACMPA